MSWKRPYLSYSAIKEFAKSPNHYIEYVKKKQQESSAATKRDSKDFGTAFHCYLLENDQFDKRFVVKEISLRSEAGKKEYQSILDGGYSVVAPKDFEKMKVMADNVMLHEASRFVMNSINEVEKKVEKELFGYPFVGVIDMESDRFIVDLKTCRDASVTAFSRDASNMDYHLQGAIYSSMTDKRFCWVAVENESPHNVSVFVQSEEAFNIGVSYLQVLVDKFIHWNGEVQGYSDSEFVELDLPPWHKYKI